MSLTSFGQLIYMTAILEQSDTEEAELKNVKIKVDLRLSRRTQVKEDVALGIS